MIDRKQWESKLTSDAGYDLCAVQAIIEAKVYKRSLKHQDLQMYTIDLFDDRLSTRDGRERFIDEKKLDIEFSQLADTLYDLAQNKETTVRFQLLLKSTAYGNGHFSALDIEISKESVKFLNYDSAGLNNWYTSERAYILFEKLAAKFSTPDKCIYYRFNPTQAVQADDSSCTVFALDALFHLSKMDTFAILENRSQEMQQHDQETHSDTVNHGKIIDLPHESIPTEFSVLYRNIQSLNRVKQLPERFLTHTINKKNQTLETSIATHTAEKQIDYKTKLANLSVEYKKAGYVTDVLNAYDQNTDRFEINAASRDIFKAIEISNFYTLSHSSLTSPTISLK